MHLDINHLSARFADPAIEQGFLAETFADDLYVNRLASLVLIALFTSYAAVDLILLDDPATAIAVRLATALPAVALLALLFLPRFQRHHMQIVGAIFVLLSIGLGTIIHTATDLENTYYIGFVQGGVCIAVLLRLTFVFTLSWMGFSVLCFAFGISTKTDMGQISTQSLVLLTMFFISGVAGYVLQRTRRREYEKTLALKNAYTSLEKINQRIEEDRASKQAVARLLLHHLRTPLHQILGFADLIAADDSPGNARETVGCIQDAAKAMSGNVERLIRYQRAEEFIFDDTPWDRIDDHLLDLRDMVAQEITLSGLKESALSLHPRLAEAIVHAINDLCTYERPAITRLEIAINRPAPTESDAGTDQPTGSDNANEADVVTIDIVMHGSSWEQSAVEAELTPLSSIENYVNAGGIHWPMALRTLNLIARLHCGTLSPRVEAACAHLTMTLSTDAQAVIRSAQQNRTGDVAGVPGDAGAATGEITRAAKTG